MVTSVVYRCFMLGTTITIISVFTLPTLIYQLLSKGNYACSSITYVYIVRHLLCFPSYTSPSLLPTHIDLRVCRGLWRAIDIYLYNHRTCQCNLSSTTQRVSGVSIHIPLSHMFNPCCYSSTCESLPPSLWVLLITIYPLLRLRRSHVVNFREVFTPLFWYLNLLLHHPNISLCIQSNRVVAFYVRLQIVTQGPIL